MSGNYAQDWKPRNLGGSIYYSPKDELKYWAARGGNAPMVAVPLATLRAAAEFRECGARHVLQYDEDGELPSPIMIQCRKQEDHDDDTHSNGYASWKKGAGLSRHLSPYEFEVQGDKWTVDLAPCDPKVRLQFGGVQGEINYVSAIRLAQALIDSVYTSEVRWSDRGRTQ